MATERFIEEMNLDYSQCLEKFMKKYKGFSFLEVCFARLLIDI